MTPAPITIGTRTNPAVRIRRTVPPRSPFMIWCSVSTVSEWPAAARTTARASVAPPTKARRTMAVVAKGETGIVPPPAVPGRRPPPARPGRHPLPAQTGRHRRPVGTVRRPLPVRTARHRVATAGLRLPRHLDAVHHHRGAVPRPVRVRTPPARRLRAGQRGGPKAARQRPAQRIRAINPLPVRWTPAAPPAAAMRWTIRRPVPGPLQAGVHRLNLLAATLPRPAGSLPPPGPKRPQPGRNRRPPGPNPPRTPPNARPARVGPCRRDRPHPRSIPDLRRPPHPPTRAPDRPEPSVPPRGIGPRRRLPVLLSPPRSISLPTPRWIGALVVAGHRPPTRPPTSCCPCRTTNPSSAHLLPSPTRSTTTNPILRTIRTTNHRCPGSRRVSCAAAGVRAPRHAPPVRSARCSRCS